MSSNQKAALLVTGASGQLGRRVVELLLENYDGTIIAATRTPEKLADFSNRGVIVRQADFEDAASLEKAFQGADRLLLISTDAMDVPGHRLAQHRNAIQAAEQAGVKHIVYTSFLNPADSPAVVAPDHRGTEETLAQTKLGWTTLRESLYTEMLLMSLPRAIQSGQLINAIGSGKASYVTREDIAHVAAAVLASSFEGRRALDITGPAAVSQEEIAATLSKLTGKHITYVPVELDALVQGMVAGGLPQPMAEAFASFDTAIAQDKLSAVSNVVEELTGRQPTSVEKFLAAHHETLVAA